MKFTLISDLHVDLHSWQWSLLDECDPSIPMVVAGDISNDVMQSSTWLAELRRRFPRVLWTAGNHDYYNLGFHRTRLASEFEQQWPYPSDVSEIDQHYTRWCDDQDIVYLDSSSAEMDGVLFLGATGWHDFNAPGFTRDQQIGGWANSMRDAQHIQWSRFGSEDWQSVLLTAQLQAEYIRDTVGADSQPKVVVTHHLPHVDLCRFTTNPVWNLLNGSFVNTLLSDCANSSVRAWCYGHTHFRGDREIDGVRYINNARGYPNENPGWQPITVEIEI